jgi:osmotically-inducible protein OsmY
MSENNRNRSSQRSDENWEQQSRYNQPQHQSGQRGQYGNQGQANYGSDYNRQNRPDYGSAYGTSGGAYENSGQGDYGGYSSDYSRDHNRDYDRDYNRYGQSSYGSSDYGTSYGNRDRYDSSHREGNYGQQQYGYGQAGQYGRDYRTRSDYPGGMRYGNRYGTAGEQSVNYDRDFPRDYDRDHNRYGSGYGNYAGYASQYNSSRRDYQGPQNANYRGEERGWWDRTRDEVSSWFGDEDAERRRRMDEKVSGYNKGKGPKDYRRSDDRIREDVCDRLADDPFVDASGIDVKVDSSEVVLTGTVERREDKRRAEDLVEGISGVSNVQNNLRVAHDTGRSSSPISGRNRADI